VCEEADVASFSLLSHHLSEGLKKITKESYLTKFKHGVSRIRSTQFGTLRTETGSLLPT